MTEYQIEWKTKYSDEVMDTETRNKLQNEFKNQLGIDDELEIQPPPRRLSGDPTLYVSIGILTVQSANLALNIYKYIQESNEDEVGKTNEEFSRLVSEQNDKEADSEYKGIE